MIALRNRGWFILPAAAMLLFITACSDKLNDEPQLAVDKGSLKDYPPCNTTINLIAGQTINAGVINFYLVNNDPSGCEGDALRIVIDLQDDWLMTGAAIHFANTPQGIPQSGGTLIPGQFDFQYPGLANLDYFSVDIPYADLGVGICDITPEPGCFFGAIHVNVFRDEGGEINTQTAWAEGQRIKRNWSMYFQVCRDCFQEQGDPEYDYETAFAFGGDPADCFIGLGFQRWGWTNGPLGEGDYEFDLWAGAGLCDLDNGTLVGTVTVNYAGGTATVAYNVDLPFLLTETHAYIGTAPFPLNNGNPTVAPGLYPFSGADPPTYTQTGLTGDIYVIAHAVVGIPQ